MATDDKGNYGTPISYATQQEDNEITFTDPFGFVLSVKGMQVSNVIIFEIDEMNICMEIFSFNEELQYFLCCRRKSGNGYNRQ